jgi:hypothetical protein
VRRVQNLKGGYVQHQDAVELVWTRLLCTYVEYYKSGWSKFSLHLELNAAVNICRQIIAAECSAASDPIA